MADVNDARNMRGQLDNQLDNLQQDHERGAMTTQDYEAITEYAAYKQRRVGSIGTLRTYLSRLRTSAKRAPHPLVAFDSTADVEALLDAHEKAGCHTATALNNHLSALRGFFEWLDGSPAHGHDDYQFRKLINNVEPNDTNPGTDPVDPEFVLSESEVATLRQHATVYPARDAALIAFLADAGPRISLTCQLKCGDVSVPTDTPGTFRPNPDGLNQKKVPDRNYRLHESQRYLRRWLNEQHPEAPDPHPDAPLFPILRGYDPDEREACAIAPSTAEYALTRAAEAADIDPDRVHPHNFRRTAVTRMRVKHDMDWEAIQLRTGWSDSSLAEMKTFYRRIDEADKLAIVDRQLGVEDPETTAQTHAEPTPCINCGRDLEAEWAVCPDCGTHQELDTHADHIHVELSGEQVEATREELQALLDENDVETLTTQDLLSYVVSKAAFDQVRNA